MAHSQETWNVLLDRIAGGEALASICRDKDMPSTSTVYEKLETDADFSGRFRARKAVGVRSIVDDCLAIADEAVTDAVEVQNKRVRIDTRLRLAGKWLSAEFGDKVALTDGEGKALAAPTTINVIAVPGIKPA